MAADDRFPPPRWGRFLIRVLVLALALAFAAVAAAGRRALGDSAADAAVGGATMTIPWVIVWMWQGWRQRRKLLRSAPADLTREQLAAALEANVQALVPSDPAVRAEAARRLAMTTQPTKAKAPGRRWSSSGYSRPGMPWRPWCPRRGGGS